MCFQQWWHFHHQLNRICCHRVFQRLWWFFSSSFLDFLIYIFWRLVTEDRRKRFEQQKNTHSFKSCKSGSIYINYLSFLLRAEFERMFVMSSWWDHFNVKQKIDAKKRNSIQMPYHRRSFDCDEFERHIS